MKYKIISVLSLVLISGCALFDSSPEAQLARCLEDKGIKMFGSTWCPYCIRQQEAFGTAWKHAPFVDCSEDKKACHRAGVEEYPTWYFPETRAKRKGYIPLQMLASFSSCPYSQEQQ